MFQLRRTAFALILLLVVTAPAAAQGWVGKEFPSFTTKDAFTGECATPSSHPRAGSTPA